MNSTKLLSLATVSAMASIFSSVALAMPGQGLGQSQDLGQDQNQGQVQVQSQGQEPGNANGIRHGKGFGKIANYIISKYDTDGDNAISLEEFLARRLARVEVRFNHIDSNDDGLISLEEARAARPGRGDIDPVEMRECLEEKLGRELPERPPLEERFSAADTNGDGSLDLDEFISARTIVIGARFNKMDSDGDGFIVQNEMVDSLKKRRAFRKAICQCRDELSSTTDGLDI